MFKKTIILFLLSCCIIDAQAQYTEWSNEEKHRNKTAYNKIIGENDNGIFMLRSKTSDMTKNVYLEHYNSNMVMAYSKILAGSKNAKIVNTFIYQDTLVVYKSQSIKSPNHDIGLYRYSINKNNEILNLPVLVSTSAEKTFSDMGDFMAFESIDKSKIGIVHTEISSERNLILAFSAFQANGNMLINAKKFELEFKYETTQILQVEVDNAGNIFVILSFSDKNVNKESPEKEVYFLYQFSVKGELMDRILGNPNLFMNRPMIEFDNKNNTLICAATFSEVNFGFTKGIRFLILEKQNLTIQKAYDLPISLSLATSLIGKRRSENNQELQQYYLRKIVPMDDGSIVTFCEEFYVTRQSYTYFVNGLSQVSARDIYNYGKIFTQRISSEGEILWDGYIQRYQSSIFDMGYYGTFYTFVKNNGIDLYFNEEARGYTEIFRYNIKADGNITKHLMFKSAAGSIALVAREGIQVSHNASIIPVSKDRKFALLKLVF